VTAVASRAPAVGSSRDADGGRPRRRNFLLVLALAALVAMIPLLLSDYWLFLCAQVLVYGVATQGLNILYGRTGQLSLAQATFLGCGGYTSYVVITHGYSPFVALVAVWVLSLVAGLVVAVPTLRLSGLRLALVTLAFGELFQWVIVHTTQTTGGTQGIYRYRQAAVGLPARIDFRRAGHTVGAATGSYAAGSGHAGRS